MEDVIIIGSGQAGLGVSYFLKRAGIRHVVLERRRIGGKRCPPFGCYRTESGRDADIAERPSSTQLRHWLCTAAMV
jgi:cation diffusion facilitator CzcD-associated flavoprotein CzcO